MNITEGYFDFHGYQTYYRVIGQCAPSKHPLILLHGGPGSSHNYFEVLDELAEDGRALVMYDQIGCGKSQAPGRTDLFNRQVWTEELVALREHLGLDQVHLLGQSWGGMLLLEYLCGHKPQGISSIILASTLPSSALWEQEQRRMIRELPQEMQDAIAEADRTGDYTTPGYQAANQEFMLRHCAPVWTEHDPEPLTRPKASGTESYVTAWGPNEFSPLGNLKDFDWIDQLSDISVPTLITSGVNDLCTPLVAKTMFDRIPNARWELFAHSRHMAFAEEREKYLPLLRDWLNEND
jgi:proline iminopeptidase